MVSMTFCFMCDARIHFLFCLMTQEPRYVGFSDSKKTQEEAKQACEAVGRTLGQVRCEAEFLVLK